MHVKDWERDIIYLVQQPRAGVIPSLSPYCLKLETWLRMSKLPYQNVNNDFDHLSYKGDVPFVEVNGTQIADSNFVISELTRMYDVQLDAHLSDYEWAQAQAYHSFIENGILWSEFYFQAKNNKYEGTPAGVIGNYTGFKKFMFKFVTMDQRKRILRKKVDAFGIGNDSPVEVEKVCKTQLKALSTILGDRPFLMGDRPTTVDATMFATLCQFIYLPINEALKQHIQTEEPNLLRYVNRMREEFWNDWDSVTSTLSLGEQPKQISTSPQPAAPAEHQPQPHQQPEPQPQPQPQPTTTVP